MGGKFNHIFGIICASEKDTSSLKFLLNGIGENFPYTLLLQLEGLKEQTAEELLQANMKTMVMLKDGTKPVTGRMYLVPPGQRAGFAKDRMLLKKHSSTGLDACLAEFAVHYRIRLVAVILAGSGQKGRKGCRAVLSHGGRIIGEKRTGRSEAGLLSFAEKEGFLRYQARSDVLPRYLEKLNADLIWHPGRLGDEISSLLVAESIVSQTDLKGRITYANPNFEKISGYSARELLGKDHRIVNSGSHSPEFFRNMWNEIKAGHTWRGEIINRDKKGNLYYVDTFIAPVHVDGVRTGYISIRRDITALRHSNQFLHGILSAIPDAFILMKGSGEILFVNEEWLRFNRQNEGRIEYASTGMNYLEVCRRSAENNADEAVWFLEKFSDLKSGKIDDFNFEYPCHSPTEQRWFRLRAYRSEEDLFLVVHENITERKLLQEQIEYNSMMFETITQGAGIGIITADLSGAIVEYNRTFLEILGYPEEYKGELSWKDITPPEYAAQDEKISDELRRTGQTRLFFKEYCRRDGSRVPVAIGGKVIDMKKGRVLCFVIDVMERRALEKQISEQQRRFAAINEKNRNALVIINGEADILYRNPEFSRLFGGSEMENLNGILDAENLAAILKELRRPQSGSGFLSLEMEWGSEKRKKFFLVDLDLLETNAESGDVYFLFFYDFTELKRNEAELIRERDRAEKAMKSRTEFLSMVSHELRSPVNVVLGLSDLLDDSGLPESGKNYLRLIRKSSEDLLRIISDFLDFGKIDSGAMQIDIGPVRLDEFLAEFDHAYGEKVRARNLRWNLKMTGDTRRIIFTDSVRLRQILSNLVNNALKFTRSGEITVSFREEVISASVSRLHFEVRDTGIGIRKENLQRIFQAFSQESTEIGRAYGGSGLGLTISQKLITMLGGEISVQSEPGKGSVFAFHIESRIAMADAVASEKPHGNFTGTALVVDDLPMNLLVMEAMLGKLGIGIVKAGSGEEALRILEEAPEKFEYLFLDLEMPGLNGWDLMKKIRKGRSKAAAVSAYSMEEEKEKVRQAGYDDFLQKPIRLADLEALLQRWASK